MHHARWPYTLGKLQTRLGCLVAHPETDPPHYTATSKVGEEFYSYIGDGKVLAIGSGHIPVSKVTREEHLSPRSKHESRDDVCYLLYYPRSKYGLLILRDEELPPTPNLNPSQTPQFPIPVKCHTA